MNNSVRHQCLIYSGAPSEHIAPIGSMIIDKLSRGYRCLYFHNPNMVSALRSWLIDAGINVSERTGTGDLVLASDQNHLDHGNFEIEPMISMLKNEALNSKADGYVGLWASGDMTWEFGSEKNLKKLLEYERRLEELFREVPVLHGVCQYHMDTLPSDSIHDALCTHQQVFINEALSRINSHYVAPKSPEDTESRPSLSASKLTDMLTGLGLPSYPAFENSMDLCNFSIKN